MGNGEWCSSVEVCDETSLHTPVFKEMRSTERRTAAARMTVTGATADEAADLLLFVRMPA